LDLYQFHGVPVAIAEVDVVQVVVDLRGVLEEHALRVKAAQKRQAGQHGTRHPEQREGQGDEHMFLVLDKNVQGIPWESIPILRGRSVSRVPSISFLVDRVQFAGWSRRQGQSEMGSGAIAADRTIIDPRKGYYILNPSGDLGRTEGRFKEWLKEMEKVGWEGVVGHAPNEQQFLDALARKDLVV
jgi:separase